MSLALFFKNKPIPLFSQSLLWYKTNRHAVTRVGCYLRDRGIKTKDRIALYFENRAEGYLYIVDRIKDVIISGGLNVYPTEIEKIPFGTQTSIFSKAV